MHCTEASTRFLYKVNIFSSPKKCSLSILSGEEQGQPRCHSGCSLIANIGDKVAFFIIDFTLNMSTLPQEDFNLSLTVDAA